MNVLVDGSSYFKSDNDFFFPNEVEHLHIITSLNKSQIRCLDQTEVSFFK